MIEKIAMLVLMAFGFSISTFLIRRWIVALDAKVDDVVRCHHECREKLPERFANKEETRTDFQTVFTDLKDHEHRISKREGKNNTGA